MEDCIFCKIVGGEIPSLKLYEDEDVYVFLDNGPVNAGHTLVVPKKHSRNALAMSADEFSTLAKKIHMVATTVKEATNAGGINITFNNESEAGQVVFHTHAHIIPRFKNDGYTMWGSGEYTEGEAEEVSEKIRKAM